MPAKAPSSTNAYAITDFDVQAIREAFYQNIEELIAEDSAAHEFHRDTRDSGLEEIIEVFLDFTKDGDRERRHDETARRFQEAVRDHWNLTNRNRLGHELLREANAYLETVSN